EHAERRSAEHGPPAGLVPAPEPPQQIGGRAVRRLSLVRGKIAKVLRVRGRRDLADRVQRIGYVTGYRLSRLPRRITRVPTPAVLPVDDSPTG
ncbi:hypothetical protein, partial [Oerskovia flava]|uniref:hypothetical protein n=1 Tax=Oerskovia flava TaxID=2986422 RepID=UPI0022409940